MLNLTFLSALLANFMTHSPSDCSSSLRNADENKYGYGRAREYYQGIMSQFSNLILIVRSIILSAYPF